MGNIIVKCRDAFVNSEIYKQFQNAYKEHTGNSIDWRDIPENLRFMTFDSEKVKHRNHSKGKI